jgi:hypothetical protein
MPRSTSSPLRLLPIPVRFATAPLVLLMGVVGWLAAPSAHARVLKLNRLEPAQIGRMERETRQQYEMALNAIDHILYEKALTLFEQTVELDPENERLRFIVVQLATYLGDTNWGAESIRFYDVAINHLRRMGQSPRLNLREQQRTQEAIERLNALQRSVSERDDARRQWGREIAKMFREELNSGGKDEDEAGGTRRRRPDGAPATAGGSGGNRGSVSSLEITGASVPAGGPLTGRPRDGGTSLSPGVSLNTNVR